MSEFDPIPEPSQPPLIGNGHDVPAAEISWLWKPFIPYEKLTILQGDAGCGKTTLILKIAAWLTQGFRPPVMEGGRLSDPAPIPPESVFFASVEEDIADSALPKFRRCGGDDRHFFYSRERERHMTLSEGSLLHAISETGARLVIIDPLQSFLPPGTAMGNISAMRPVFTSLSNVAESTGAAIVILGHVTKNENARDIHRGFGSADIAAAARSVIMVSTDKDDIMLPRVVRTVKCNFDGSDYSPIYFSLEKGGNVELIPSSTDTSKHPAKLQEAVDFLKNSLSDGKVESGAMLAMIAEKGISERTANRAKKELGATSVRRNGKSYWLLKK